MNREDKLRLVQEKINNIELNYMVNLILDDVCACTELDKEEVKNLYEKKAHTAMLSIFEDLKINSKGDK